MRERKRIELSPIVHRFKLSQLDKQGSSHSLREKSVNSLSIEHIEGDQIPRIYENPLKKSKTFLPTKITPFQDHSQLLQVDISNSRNNATFRVMPVMNDDTSNQQETDKTIKLQGQISEPTEQIQQPHLIVTRVMRSSNIKINYPKFVIPQYYKLKVIWDTFLIILILWLSLFIPWQIAFPDDSIRPLDIIITIFFITDIILTFRTSFYDDDGNEILDPIRIRKNYFQSTVFWIDVVSAVPISELYQGQNKNVLRILSVIKMVRLMRIGRLLKLLKSSELKLFSKLLQNLMVFIMFFHWLTCIWLAIVISQYDSENFDWDSSWSPSNDVVLYSSASDKIKSERIKDFYVLSTHLEQYLYGYYCIMMNLTGQNEYPITLEQNYYLVFSGIAGCVSLALIFGEFQMTLQVALERSQAHDIKQDETMQPLYQQNLPQETIDKGLEYFEFIWRRGVLVNHQSKSFLEFNKSLTRQCLLELFEAPLRKIPIFQKMKGQMLLEVIKRMRTLVFMPGDFVLCRDEIIKELIIVREGMLEDIVDGKDPLVLMEGDHFGVDSLFRGITSEHHLKSVSFTTLEVISSSQFQLLMEDQVLDFKEAVNQSLKEYAQSLSYQKPFSGINIHELEALFECSDDIFLKHGQVMFEPQSVLDGFYIVMFGVLDVNQYLEEPQDYIDIDEQIQYAGEFDKITINGLLQLTAQYPTYSAFGTTKRRLTISQIPEYQVCSNGYSYVLHISEVMASNLWEKFPSLKKKIKRLIHHHKQPCFGNTPASLTISDNNQMHDYVRKIKLLTQLVNQQGEILEDLENNMYSDSEQEDQTETELIKFTKFE